MTSHSPSSTWPLTEALDALVPGERLPVVVGDVVAKKYRVEKILGMGSLAVVAVASVLERVDDKHIALKVMRKARASSAEAVAMFASDTKAAQALKSKHVARVIDAGMDEERKLPFVAMELLENGTDVATVLERQGVMKPSLAIDYIAQACDALSEAHKVGLIHRDLRPKNLFLTHSIEDGAPVIKVLDFGTARIAYDALSKRNPMYMSPEQVRGSGGGSGADSELDARTDVWSLGAILFELVTGHRAFDGDSIDEILAKITEGSPPSLEVHLPNAPPGLSTVIARCLEKDRKRRYATAGALSMALSDLTSPPSSSAVPAWDRKIDLTVDPLLTVSTVTAEAPPSSRRLRANAPTMVVPRRKKSRAPMIALVLIGLAGASMAGVLIRKRLSKQEPAPTATVIATATATASVIVAPSASTTAEAASPPSSGSAAPEPSMGLSKRGHGWKKPRMKPQ